MDRGRSPRRSRIRHVATRAVSQRAARTGRAATPSRSAAVATGLSMPRRARSHPSVATAVANAGMTRRPSASGGVGQQDQRWQDERDDNELHPDRRLDVGNRAAAPRSSQPSTSGEPDHGGDPDVSRWRAPGQVRDQALNTRPRIDAGLGHPRIRRPYDGPPTGRTPAGR